MKYIAILAILLLSACASKPVPVKMDFPDAPLSIQKKCENLRTVEPKQGGIPITDLLKTVVANYTMYYECSNKVDGWLDWYTKTKKIYDGVGE